MIPWLLLESDAMSLDRRIDPRRALGRSPESLELEELAAWAGLVIALEIYTPKTLPLRAIEAIGGSAGDCMAELRARGLDPRRFEYIMLKVAV
ncbi:MAG TPA: hypothetical protein VHA11_12335 [Bryobacteraceae bacterium]|nr:hypothetical protein [Bryobacteraceae bacterium]